jgi:hypothetical protein
MKITLKNVKYFAAMSEETNCFTADVCLDGIVSLRARNEGHGGSTHLIEVRPGALAKLETYAATLPPVVSHIKDAKSPNGFFTYDLDSEGLVNEALEEHLTRKKFKAAIKYPVYVSKGECFTHKVREVPATRDAIRASIKARYPDAVILNELPEEEAFALFLKHTQPK